MRYNVKNNKDQCNYPHNGIDNPQLNKLSIHTHIVIVVYC
jgi:hypothetical protein